MDEYLDAISTKPSDAKSRGLGGSVNDAIIRTRSSHVLRVTKREDAVRITNTHQACIDPIQRLPPELSGPIIRNALPSNSGYAAHLLTLTMVSLCWQHFILSTPSLWTLLYVDERLPDLYATLAIFLHRSVNMNLTLVIVKTGDVHWGDVGRVLRPDSARITSLTIERIGINDLARGIALVSALSSVLDCLGRLPNLNEVDGDRVTPLDLSKLGALDLPNSVSFSRGLTVQFPDILSRKDQPRLFEVEKYISICSTVHTKQLFGCSSIALSSRSWNATLHLIATGVKLQNLSDASRQFGRWSSLEECICFTAASLFDLEIHINDSPLNDLFDCLQVLPCLQRLVLWILPFKDDEPASAIIPSHTVVPGLHTLIVGVYSSLGSFRRSLGHLFSAFTSLYPAIQEFKYYGNNSSFFPSTFIEHLASIRSLMVMMDSEPEPITITSFSLRELRVMNARLRPLNAPNLLSLTLEMATSVFEKLDLALLRKLRIVDEGYLNLSLSDLGCPDLCELDLNMALPFQVIDFTQLSQLSSITLSSKCFTHPQGTALCTVLVYNPELCSSLQRLKFNNCVEWDLFFLMLRRRNFNPHRAKRIHTVALPFVPHAFRQALQLLLSGENCIPPTFESLSLEYTREILFDSTIPGCFSCLKNMWPGCMEKVENTSDLIIPANEFYPVNWISSPAEAGEVPTEIHAQMCKYSELAGIWRESYDEFTLDFSRPYACARFEAARAALSNQE